MVPGWVAGPGLSHDQHAHYHWPAGPRGAAALCRWLKANQPEPGRGFTRSLNREGWHCIANAGTAFAILALKAYE
jgi:hypothetical protein